MAISFEFFTKERADKLVRHHDALIPLFDQIYDNERVCDVAFGLDMPEAKPQAKARRGFPTTER